MTLTGDTVTCITHPDVEETIRDTIRTIAGQSLGYEVEFHEVGVSPNAIDYENTALAVTVGGDGTFLEGVRLTAPEAVPLLAVNTGSLGFLARIDPDDLPKALTEVLHEGMDPTIVEREMLTVNGAIDGIGINDVMVEPVPPESPTDRKICTVHAYIDETYVGEFTGSGVAVATPTGSTAVAFSAGGPVHYPNANSSLQLTPLHTHNAGVRPVIVDSDTEITLIPETPVDVAIDGGRTHARVAPDEEITVTGAEQTARIVRTKVDESFFDAMAGKLGWGLRGVDEAGPRSQAEE